MCLCVSLCLSPSLSLSRVWFSVGTLPLHQLRLVNGNSTAVSPREGRLEILYKGVWGSICGGRFGDSSAQVACAGLGFGLVVAILNHKVSINNDLGW